VTFSPVETEAAGMPEVPAAFYILDDPERRPSLNNPAGATVGNFLLTNKLQRGKFIETRLNSATGTEILFFARVLLMKITGLIWLNEVMAKIETKHDGTLREGGVPF